jgi:thiol-disulfide isomerase/thioredoxin
VFKAKRRTIVTTAAAAVVLLAGALAVTLLTGNSGSSGTETVKGNTVLYNPARRPAAPEFAATTLTGTKINLSSYRGQTVVLNFWGSWCPPCREEAPTLAVLSQQYAKKGVAFIGDDVQDTTVNALAFTRGVGITYPSINDSGGRVVQAFAQVTPLNDTPVTIVIDKTGHVAGLVLGQASYGDLTTLLQEAAK